MNQFQSVQRGFAAHLRNPAVHPAPAGIEDRRLRIYRELIYNNIEGFLSSGFPVLHSIYASADWHALVNDFVASHVSRSPYFSEIAEEFLAYLEHERGVVASDPPFLLELAHYEWVELALDIADVDLSEPKPADTANVLDSNLAVSPLAWPLAYRYRVHHIGPEFQPDEPGEEPTYLVVYRNHSDDVRFMEINAVTFRLLQLLQEESTLTGAQALEKLAEEMQHPDPAALLPFGEGLLAELQQASILLADG